MLRLEDFETRLAYIDNSGRRRREVKTVCDICNKVFWARWFQFKNGKGRFCSHSCSATNSAKSKKVIYPVMLSENLRRVKPYGVVYQEIRVQCEYCDKKFWTRKYVYERGKGRFCSNKCLLIHRNKSLDHRELVSRSMSGKGNHNWKGGVRESYPPEFSEDLKSFIRDRDNHRCRICNDPPLKTQLPVHHIDNDKYNNDPNNLITLCLSCHVSIHNSKRATKEIMVFRSRLNN